MSEDDTINGITACLDTPRRCHLIMVVNIFQYYQNQVSTGIFPNHPAKFALVNLELEFVVKLPCDLGLSKSKVLFQSPSPLYSLTKVSNYPLSIIFCSTHFFSAKFRPPQFNFPFLQSKAAR